MDFFDKLRDEILNRELFHSGMELQASLDDYCEFYNHDRPHRGLNGKTPIRFKNAHLKKDTETEILTL